MPPRGPVTAKVKPGDSLASFIGRQSGKRRALFLALSTRCGFCTKEIPLYRKVQAEFPDVALIGLFPENEQAVKAYLSDQDFQLDIRPGLNLVAVGVSSTPTVILGDSEGRVTNIWQGQLSLASQQELFSKLR